MADLDQVQQIIADAHAAGRSSPRELARYLLDHLVIAVPDSEATSTRRDFPRPSVGAAAVAVALQQLGKEEVGGTNTGPIVEWSAEGITTRTGIPWCALFASQCIRQVLLADGPQSAALAQQWQQIASAGCDTLWERLGSRGWTWTREHAALMSRPPLLGDLVFFGPASDLHHVGLVAGADADSIATVEGNADNAVRRRTYRLTDGRIYGYARIPW